MLKASETEIGGSVCRVWIIIKNLESKELEKEEIDCVEAHSVRVNCKR